MRIPRDLSGGELIKKLGRLGYRVTRQTGSHIRLTSRDHGEHHITVPNHDPLRMGPWLPSSMAWLRIMALPEMNSCGVCWTDGAWM
jgi:predicted RNA binding protein YcfA (HicA-like mRNA interferase family)